MATPSARGSPLVTFLVLLLLLAAALGGAEAWARARYPAEALLPVPEMPFLVDDPVLLWRLRPDHSAATVPGGPVMHTNAQGFRDGPVGPKAGRTRLLSLGESSTWGFGVGDGQTYSDVLEGRLGAGFDVLNAGQPAWSIWQTWRFVGTEAAALEPDVLLVYHLNNDRLPRGASNRRDPFHVALTDRQLTEAREPLAPVVRVLSASRLQALLWQRWLAPRLVSGAASVARDVVRVPPADREAAWAGLVGWCAGHGVRLVVIHPVYGGPNAQRDSLLPRVAGEAGATYVDLPAIKARAGQKDFFMVDDTHPTVEGHRWIGEALAAALAPVLGAPGGAP